MKSSRIAQLFAVLFLFSAVSAFAATSTPKAASAPSHGLKFHGAVVSVDDKAKTFAAKDSAGKTMDFAWNDATKAPKTGIASGQNVSVHYMTKEGKNVATVIAVAPVQAAAHAASKSAPKARS
jgi:N-acetyl-anhydromuramyl-L-alanine amidase AmpD